LIDCLIDRLIRFISFQLISLTQSLTEGVAQGNAPNFQIRERVGHQATFRDEDERDNVEDAD
jgi:hypothetical protein